MKFNPWAAVAAFAIVVAAVVVLIVTKHGDAIAIAAVGVTSFITALLPVLSKLVSSNETRGDLQ